jgi:hypothetical protein
LRVRTILHEIPFWAIVGLMIVFAINNGYYAGRFEEKARKVKADGNGNESPMPLNDYIDIGVFKGKKDEEQPLYLKK